MFATPLRSERKTRLIFKIRDQFSSQSVKRFSLDLKDPVRNTDDIPPAFFLSKPTKKLTNKSQIFENT